MAARRPPRDQHGEQSDNLYKEVEKTQASLGAHREFITSKLSAVSKYSARLDDVTSWVHETRTRLNIAADLPPPQAAAVRANVARAVQERSSWVRDVIENYNNLERECVAAAHPVCPRLALRHLALRAHWDDLLPAAPNPPDRSGDLSARRRSSQQSPAALIADFDTTVQQVTHHSPDILSTTNLLLSHCHVPNNCYCR
ncbi:uncharacterized protein LOC114244810 [Bombyx mandarina]|uniref:Uncharacterized protein LOC114244810 n=1 Tax=Bombyx mandarina TaxID=7092 RepID=A0A6J2JSL6_BOMMA|nr:uncharacterized protein LOC114244810 [Bombyx mandarina]